MISYRRDDSAGWARSLYGQLVDRFGETQVFMDVDTIAPGEDFVDAIDREIRRRDVMLAVIGTRWLAATTVWVANSKSGTVSRIEVRS